jgi:hypothetical protein
VPFRIIVAIIALASAIKDFVCRDKDSAKMNLFSTVRLLEYAAGDLICIFNDEMGQHWTTDAYVHIKFYLFVKQPIELRQKAVKEWFSPPLEYFQKLLSEVNNSLPPWAKQLAAMKRESTN